MAINFPGSLDTSTTLPQPSAGNNTNNPSHAGAHDNESLAIIATETKIGTGASTPTNNTALLGNGVGTSAWGSTLTNFTITTPTLNGSGGALTLPAGPDTLIGRATTDTLTNKTLTSPTLTTPTIASFINAQHNHSSAAQGGSITQTIIAGGSSTQLVDQSNNALDIEARAATTFANFVESGAVWSQSSGLVGTMTSGFVWINGRRISVASIGSHTFTASKDTYCDVGTAGTITFTEAANNGTSPSLGSNSIRLAIVVTSGAAITSINTGSTAATAPTVSSNILTVCDSLGNLIYPTSPQPGLIGYRTITSSVATTAPLTATAIAGLSLPVIIPAGRKVKVSFYGVAMTSDNSTGVSSVAICLGSASNTNRIAQSNGGGVNGTNSFPAYTEVYDHNTGSQTYVACVIASAGNHTLTAAATSPAFIKAELV